jgi:hypothetical protein
MAPLARESRAAFQPCALRDKGLQAEEVFRVKNPALKS